MIPVIQHLAGVARDAGGSSPPTDTAALLPRARLGLDSRRAGEDEESRGSLGPHLLTTVSSWRDKYLDSWCWVLRSVALRECLQDLLSHLSVVHANPSYISIAGPRPSPIPILALTGVWSVSLAWLPNFSHNLGLILVPARMQ